MLFAVIGTTYGNGGNTEGFDFSLPDLRGRTIVGTGDRTPETSARLLGSKGGNEDVALTIGQLPSHFHYVGFAIDPECTAGGLQHGDKTTTHITSGATIGSGGSSSVGGSQPHPNMQPFLALKYIMKAK